VSLSLLTERFEMPVYYFIIILNQMIVVELPIPFYPRNALHSAAIAVVACPTHAGIESKRIKISSNFFLGLVAPPLWILLRDADIIATYLLRRRGWVAGCPSHACVVSKRQNLSKDFCDRLIDHLVAHSTSSFF